MDCSMPGFPVLHCLPEFAQTHVHWFADTIQPSLKRMFIDLLIPSSHLIVCHPLLLLPSIFPSIRVFSSESVLLIKWPKYWSFSFSISPSNESSGLISFRMDWFDLLAVQGTLKTLLQNHSLKASILQYSAFFILLIMSKIKVCWLSLWIGNEETGTLIYCWWEYGLVSSLWSTTWQNT